MVEFEHILLFLVFLLLHLNTDYFSKLYIKYQHDMQFISFNDVTLNGFVCGF